MERATRPRWWPAGTRCWRRCARACPRPRCMPGRGRDADDRVREAVDLAAAAGIPMIEAGRAELDRLTGGSVHQGLALRVRPYAYAAAGRPDRARPGRRGPGADRRAGRGHRSAQPGCGGPLGRRVRRARRALPARRSARVTAGAWKASAGALARVPVAQVPNLARALAAYQQAGLFVVGLDAGRGHPGRGPGGRGRARWCSSSAPRARGLSRLVAERCDVLARIPMAADDGVAERGGRGGHRAARGGGETGRQVLIACRACRT